MNEIDFLTEDPIKIPEQNFALISIVSPSTSQQCMTTALKIRGVFSNEKDANKHLEKLMKLDNNFDVFLVEMNKWLQIPPEIDHIQDQVYQDKRLNQLIQGYHEEQLKSKEFFESRKQEEIEQAIKKMKASYEENTVEPSCSEVENKSENDITYL